MVLYFFLWLCRLALGLFIGWSMSFITRTRRRIWADLLIGVLGAFLGGFLFELVPVMGITDFNLWSLIPSALGALAFLSVFRWVNYREQPFGITKEDHENERITVVHDNLPAEEGLRDELSADAVPPPEFTDEDLESKIRFGKVYFPAAIPLILIIMLPILDYFLLYLRYPSISQAPPPFGTVQTYKGEDGSLDYLVYTPPSYNEAEASPLLVLLHGCTQDPVIIESASGMRAVADSNNFLIVYPQQNNLSSPHRCWNWYSQNNQQRDRGEAALIVGIVNEVKQGYNVDANRVYVTGLSSGGALSSILASCYPDVFAAAAIHSGMAYESARNEFEALLAPVVGSRTEPSVAGQDAYACSGLSNQPIPVLVLQGQVDKVVFPVNGLDTIEQFAQTNDLADDGSDNDSVSADFSTGEVEQVEGGYNYTVASLEANNEILLQYYTVDGLNHMWSGGTGILPLSDPKGPNASEIFWNFLSAHSLP